MQKTRRSSWLPFIVMAVSGQAMGQDLSLVVSADKEKYEFAEPIHVTVTVQNNSGRTYTLARTPFDLPGWELFRIKSPAGKTVRSQREYGSIPVDRRPKTITLVPGDSYIRTFDLLYHYPEMHSFHSPHNFDEPGTYELVTRYYLEYARHWEHIYEGIFVGPLQSDPVRFVVKPLKGARLEQVLQQLQEEDVAGKVESLSLLRRGGAVHRIPNLLQFLNEDQPRELRFEAAYAIYDAPDPSAWKTYAAFLDDPDRMFRCYMAEALGKIGNKAAGDALYAVTDPKKYPRSYWVAFESLVKIGDPRAREVSARLAESAEFPTFRQMAVRFLREGVLREGSVKPANTSQKKKP